MRRSSNRKTNPFDKYLGPEDHLHCQVCELLRYQYPKALWYHCPNEGKRTAFERYLFKKMGCKAGVLDILIFDNGGLAIELKIHPNTPSDNQNDWIRALTLRGWKAAVCYTLEEAQAVIADHFRGYRFS